MLLEFITGPAGTGKTTLLKTRIDEARAALTGRSSRGYATLTATTGIAALNLSGGTGDVVSTINSTLKFFDTASLQDNFAARKLHRNLGHLPSRNLAIDEISMMDARQLDLIYDALVEVNETAEVSNRGGLGLILSGDFAQLPPVKAEFAFKAKCWNKFKITKLEKVWRQSDIQYLEMLNAARAGDGEKAARLICQMDKVTLRGVVDSHFDGTTIVPINRLVDSLNKIRLDELLAEKKTPWEFKTFRWGRQLSDWKNVPESIMVCRDAYVMILANDAPDFSYANGSCGYIIDSVIDSGTAIIRLKENSREVRVRRVTRYCFQRELPEGCIDVDKWMSKTEWLADNKSMGYTGKAADAGYKSYLGMLTADSRIKNGLYKPYFHYLEEKWVVGEISYTPVRLAYATTVHKCQGLSLDQVQIDYTHAFFGEPSMSYVSLSRCRTPEGLTVVGNRKLIEDRTNISCEILDWV